jgi:hypothetical protein
MLKRLFLVLQMLVAYGCHAPAFAADSALTTPRETAVSHVEATDTGHVVPVQNPWGVRIGVDSCLVVPATQARQLTVVAVERNACVSQIQDYKVLVSEHVRLHSLDSVSIANLHTQTKLNKDLCKVNVEQAGTGKWTWAITGFGIGAVVTAGVGVVVLVLANSISSN